MARPPTRLLNHPCQIKSELIHFIQRLDRVFLFPNKFHTPSAAIFLIGIPAIRYVFPAAVVLGCGVAIVLHFIRHETTGAPWIRSATKR